MSTIRYNPNPPSSTAASGPKRTRTNASSAGSAGNSGSAGSTGSSIGGSSVYNASFQFGSTGNCGSTYDGGTPFEFEVTQNSDGSKTYLLNSETSEERRGQITTEYPDGYTWDTLTTVHKKR